MQPLSPSWCGLVWGGACRRGHSRFWICRSSCFLYCKQPWVGDKRLQRRKPFVTLGLLITNDKTEAFNELVDYSFFSNLELNNHMFTWHLVSSRQIVSHRPVLPDKSMQTVSTFWWKRRLSFYPQQDFSALTFKTIPLSPFSSSAAKLFKLSKLSRSNQPIYGFIDGPVDMVWLVGWTWLLKNR